MTTTIHNLVQTLLSQWLESGATPESPIEGIAPEFANLLGVRPEEFTFDSLFHGDETPDWMWKTIEFNEVFDGQFFFYLPTAWSQTRQEKLNVIFGDTIATRQSILLAKKSFWQPQIINLLQEVKVIAFAYYPLYRPHYHQWVFVTEDKNTGSMWTFGVYSAGDYIVIVKGDAPTISDINHQLTSLINTNPWYGWIESAKAR